MARSIFEHFNALHHRGLRLDIEAFKQGLINPLKKNDPRHLERIEGTADAILKQMDAEGRLHPLYRNHYRHCVTPGALMYCRNLEQAILPEPGTYTVRVTLVRLDADFMLQMAGAPAEYVEGDLHTLVSSRAGLHRKDAKLGFYRMIYGMNKDIDARQKVEAVLPEVVAYRDKISTLLMGAGTATPRRTLMTGTKFTEFLALSLREIIDRMIERIDLDLLFCGHGEFLLSVPSEMPVPDAHTRIKQTIRDTFDEMVDFTLPDPFRLHVELATAPWDDDHCTNSLV